MVDGRINDFDLSKVEHDDHAPSDSEPLFNRNSISNSPTRNRKPIQNSQPKTNLQVDFANMKANESKINTVSNSQSGYILPPRNQHNMHKVYTPNRH